MHHAASIPKRLIVHEQSTDEVPVARFVETEHPVAQSRKAQTIEAKPAVAVGGQAPRVPRKKQQVCIAPVAVGAMA